MPETEKQKWAVRRCWLGRTGNGLQDSSGLGGRKGSKVSCLGNGATGKVICTCRIKKLVLQGPTGDPLSSLGWRVVFPGVTGSRLL